MRGGMSLLVALGCLAVTTEAFRCDRTPEGTVTPKTPADNRFQLKVSGSPEKYVPNEGYTISLWGQRSPGHSQVAQKFVGFSLVVEPQNFTPLKVMTPRDITPRPIGTFTLYGDSMTKFSPSCPNMVTHTSSMPKTEVQVRWTAPPPGSGCVIFRATVIEHRDVWYQDDGPLSKMLCEEVQENLDTQPEVLENCCACDEAKYEVTFEGLWSRHTHPKDFPSNSWLTRFSDIIGASHSPHYKFWEYGGFASEGLRQVAERGSTRMLESELKSHSSEIRTIIKARGISYPNVTGKTFAVFRVNRHHHLMSLVSMIDPSPDWIVGVSALELCIKNCSWIESKVLNLYPWDAGTDSGLTYIAGNEQTFPREKIRRLTSSFPNDPRSPFYDPSGLEMKPLARLYLTRQRLYEKTCDETRTPSDECGYTEWTMWGPCSATCGRGKQYRRREFRRSSKNCPPAKLTDFRECIARHCRPLAQPSQEEQEDPNCEDKQWGDWSRCMPKDSSCKEGVQKRYRTVTSKANPKYCLKMPSLQERACTLSIPPSTCPKNNRGKVFHKDPQSSTCCEENKNENDYGHENNETIDQDFPDENAVEEETNDENGQEGKENGEGGEEEYGNGEGNEEFGEGNTNEGDENGDQNPAENGEEDENFNGQGNGNEEENGNGDENGNEGENGNEEEHGNENGEGDENLIENEEGEDNYRRNSEGNYETGQENGEESNNMANNYDDDGGDNNEMWPEEPTGECAMLQWSSWSQCSVTCGTGVTQRSRQLKYPSDSPRAEYQRAPPPEDGDYGDYGDDETKSEGEYAEEPCNMYKILEIEPCNGTYYSCQFSPEDARGESGEQTTEEPTPGDKDLEALGQTMDQYGDPVEGTERPVRNCKFSRWSSWSECDAPCNQAGFKERTRHIEIHAKNGGKSCTGKTRKQKRCFRKCKDGEDQDGEKEVETHSNGRCRYDEWTSWTPCTATCGLMSVRQRTRQVVFGNPSECDDRVRKMQCNVGPCPAN